MKNLQPVPLFVSLASDVQYVRLPTWKTQLLPLAVHGLVITYSCGSAETYPMVVHSPRLYHGEGWTKTLSQTSFMIERVDVCELEEVGNIVLSRLEQISNDSPGPTRP